MCSDLSIPYSWDSIDRNILLEKATLFKSFTHKAIKTFIARCCIKHLGFASVSTHNLVIESHPLLGIKGAAAIIRFKEYPKLQNAIEYQISGTPVGGTMRLVHAGDGVLPVVLIFPGARESTLEHECIHLCQALNSRSYLLTLNERNILTQDNMSEHIDRVVSTDPEYAMDLLIRLTCYKFWIELEAHYFTQYNSPISAHDVLERAQISSQPMNMIINGIPAYTIDKYVPNAISRGIARLQTFCDELESQVDWVADLVVKTGNTSLSEALWFYKRDE